MTATFQASVYLLCFVTSAVCAALLTRSYLASRARLLLWTALCFGLLTLNNLFLFADVVLLPSWDLLAVRHLASLGAIVVLLIGFVWDSD
ncbi:DUF5985 family protein [Salinarimonas soli]|uniref:Uncharacterized protein n=1 Tax=Salinarimonas soli TaxID=1638099 RepID=A0A5B2V6L2_9HYPH|nr:DUF5985 family protein [Salinarimonas soli]KAA2234160.1 hypothetical protein F0L46_24205 [Salinarimonas soli]